MIEIDRLVRENIRKLKPYSCARYEFRGEASVFLDANENPMNTPYNRYPDPLQEKLKTKIAAIKHVRTSQIMLGVGSDEPIDLIIRIFCEPREENIVATDPTYNMYNVCADINNVGYRGVLLNDDYSLDAGRILEAVDEKTKVIFLCSPNNPTGNLLDRGEVMTILNGFGGIVVIDEAYIDFSSQPSWLEALDEHPGLIVLQTFSKAWGLASVRCGMAFAGEKIIGYLNKVKYPYNINMLTQEFVIRQLEDKSRKEEWVKMLLAQREIFAGELAAIPLIEKVYPSEANFWLVKVADADDTYKKLVDRGIVVRNRNKLSLCGGCLRITVGTASENEQLIHILKQL
jgi:histidinol-phosphate aminotransferase